jgi:uncharacterized membrane protein HdeD (DUF308 family)
VDAAKSLAMKANPLRAEMSWPIILIEGLVAGGIGLYALLAEDNARRNLLFLIGAFLLLNGLGYAFRQFQSRGSYNPMATFQLLRAGIGITVGLLVVIDRISDFMGADATRVVLGIGLLGIGLVTLAGMLLVRDEVAFRTGALISALLLSAWGIIMLYQASSDTSSTRLLGWMAIIVGGGLIGLAIFRWQRSQPAAR